MKKIITLLISAAIACSVLIGCGTNNNGVTNDGSINQQTNEDFTAYNNETVWGKITSVSDTGFKMDVGILDDSNAFSANDEKADVTLNPDTDKKMSAFNDAMGEDWDMQDATVDNLKVGDLVAVEYDEDGEVDSVIIKMPTDNE